MEVHAPPVHREVGRRKRGRGIWVHVPSSLGSGVPETAFRTPVRSFASPPGQQRRTGKSAHRRRMSAASAVAALATSRPVAQLAPAWAVKTGDEPAHSTP
jgi:hypothetical protein